MIIITGMDMPKTCKDCAYPNCDYYKAEWCRHDDYTINYKNSRGISCPLKSVDGLIEKLQSCLITHGQVIEGEYFSDDAENYNLELHKAIDIIREYCVEDQE